CTRSPVHSWFAYW
nr:immunoglobulin heavy chain junction region [Mus musculus]MBK4197443.1 immunoglobulin heavy chain junction region [Mus musculus]